MLTRRLLHKNIWLTLMVVAGFSAVSSATHAAPVLDLINVGHGIHGENTLVDDNREYLIDNVVTERGQIDVGDSIRGHAIWTKINGNPLGFGTVNDEITSVFQFTVTGKEAVGDGEYHFTFGPDPSFAEANELGLGGQALMVFYQDSTPNGALDYDDPTSPFGAGAIDDGTTFSPPSPEDIGVPGTNEHEEAFIQTATDGEYFWALGFTGEIVDGVAQAAPGEGFESLDGMTDNVLDFFDADSGADLGSSNYSVNRLDSPVADGLGDDLLLRERESFFNNEFLVEFNGSQTFEGVRNELTAFGMSTQSTLAFAVIPLPSAAGMGMLLLSGLGGLKLWRRRHEGEIV